MIKSLRQRLILFLLLPVASLLFIMDFVGFIFAKATMLDERREAAILKLQRAAHHMDMRLSRPIEWMEIFHKTGGYRGDFTIQQWILDQLKDLKGVTKVDLQRVDNGPKLDTFYPQHTYIQTQIWILFIHFYFNLIIPCSLLQGEFMCARHGQRLGG